MKKIVSLILFACIGMVTLFGISGCGDTKDDELTKKLLLLQMMQQERILFEIPKGVAQ